MKILPMQKQTLLKIDMIYLRQELNLLSVQKGICKKKLKELLNFTSQNSSNQPKIKHLNFG